MPDEKQDEIEHLRTFFVRPDKKPKSSIHSLMQNLAATLTPWRGKKPVVEPVKVKINKDAA
jgi:hypothetical protein